MEESTKKAYVFLDIDGVLNSRTTKCDSSFCLDTGLLTNYFRFLTELEKKFKGVVILSSTWRMYPKHCDYLKKHGVVWKDTTAKMSCSPTRAFEILEYIERYNLDFDCCWVLDDMVSSKSFDSKEIKVIGTSYERGFDAEMFDYAMGLINES